MLPFDWTEIRSLRDRFLLWFYPNRGWSADLHGAPHAAKKPEVDAVPPDATAGCGARASAG